MPKTVYMVASGSAAEIFLNPDIRWTKECSGTVFVGRVRSDAMRDMFDGDVIYRCEPIDPDAPEPEPQPRTVKAYVAYDPDRGDRPQDILACTSESLARAYCPESRIYEIEMREVTPNQKRDKGWAIAGGSNGRLYGHGGYGVSYPFVFGDKFVADELAKKLGIGDTAIEVYADTLEPVDGE